MRVLLNYSKEDKPYLEQVASMLKSYGVSSVAATSTTHEISSLISTAKQAQCTAIILANAETLNHCVQGKKPTLDDFRGSRLKFSVPAIVINKLEHIHTVPHGEWLLGKDFEKLKDIHRLPQPFTFKVLEYEDQFSEALQTLETCWCIVFDAETVPTGNGLMTSVSFTGLLPDGRLVNYVVPLIDFGVPHYESDQGFAAAIRFIRAVMALECVKAAHSAAYDAQYSIKYRAFPHWLALDTMVMWHSWWAELPKDLAFIASILLYDYYQWKNELAMAKQNKDKMSYWAYNAKDTFNTARILVKLLEQMPEWAVNNYKKTFSKFYAALYCNFEGFAVDYDRHKKLKEESEKKLEKAQRDLRIMSANPTFNPGSSDQCAELLFGILGAKKPTKRVNGKVVDDLSTDEKHLNKIAAQHPLLARICDDILQYRKAAKAISTYFNFTPIQDRVFWSIIIGGTETDRYACVQSAFYGGLQIQNVPSKDSKSKINAKGFMRADEGFELIELDNNKAEARCVAYLAQCLQLIEALETPDKDFYKILATIFFGLAYEEVSKDLRNNVVKRIIHGTNYLMQADTFIDTATPKRLYEGAALLGIKVTDLRQFAGYLLELYHKKFPEVRQWYEEIKNEIRLSHLLVSPRGYTRYFFGNIDKNTKILKNAVAHSAQNLNVDIINDGFERIYRQLVLPSNGDIRLKAQIHDSILAQVRKTPDNSLRMYYIENSYKLTHEEVPIHGRTLIIPRDYKIGEYWDEMEEFPYPPKAA